MAGVWKFRIMDKSEKKEDPFQSQFFTTNIVGGLSAALVRETIQNSLDAKVSDDEGQNYSVRVRFALSGSLRAVPPEKVQYYLGMLIPHLKSDDNDFHDLPDFSRPLTFLAIEDWNTIGLVGDPGEFEDPPEDGGKHNFYWFWRNVGRSGKVHDARGRWGLGKAVYPKSSIIHTYFGLTVRESDDPDDPVLLMGESILKIHKIPNQPDIFYPYGYFGKFNDRVSEYFVNPLDDIENKKDIIDFISDFSLQRINENSKYTVGLSLVIPYPSEEITGSELIKSVITQYFYPVMLDQLSVTVEDADYESVVRIEKDSVFSVIAEIDFPANESARKMQLQKLMAFTRWVIDEGGNNMIVLKEPDMINSPAWYNDWYIDDEIRALIDEKADHFSRGGRAGFRVPVKVHPAGRHPRMTWFRVFMENDSSLEEPDCHFIRDGITIVGVKPIRRKSVRALVIIDDPLLSKLLGDAENPAHTEWSRESPNFAGKYVSGEKVISFVVNSLDKLYSWLSKPTEGLDEDIFRDIFYLNAEDDETEAGEEPESGEKGNKTGDPGVPVNGEPSPVTVNKIQGGVSFRRNPSSESLPATVTAEIAYMRASGNPFKKYSPLDFDMAAPEINIETENAEILVNAEKFLTFRITGGDYRVEVTGFDPERDLVVRTNFNDQEI